MGTVTLRNKRTRMYYCRMVTVMHYAFQKAGRKNFEGFYHKNDECLNI